MANKLVTSSSKPAHLFSPSQILLGTISLPDFVSLNSPNKTQQLKAFYIQFALKQELLQKIALIEDENLLLLSNEDYEYFSQHHDAVNILDTLTPRQAAELTEMVNEPFGHETESYYDFKQATERWRTK